jgi:glycogen operon protein
MDVFSYGEKHNEANGEENRDGNNYNCSFNYGQEGPTTNRGIMRVRMTNMRTAMALLLLSQGVPQILSGDEVGNTAFGNNNPYCQDNEVGWVHFTKRKGALRLQEYVKNLIAFRKNHTVLSVDAPMQQNDYQGTGLPDMSYHGKEPWIMGIGEERKAIGILYNGAYGRKDKEEDVMVCINFYYGDELFALPKLLNGRKWYQVSNTAEDEWNPSTKPLTEQSSVSVPGGTVTILIGK